MQRIITAIVAVATLAGCHTHQVLLRDAAPVPAERTEVSEFLHPAEGTQAIAVIRDGGSYKSMGYTVIWIDGEKVAALNTSEAVTLYLPPGKHIVTTGMRVLGAENMMGPTLPINAPSKITKYRISWNSAGMLIQPAIE
ncbi:lipoprotein [Caballeronia grimmiae]|uniref:lipoprotein n=1 Tax=Caballeronia grimmiae TaxID=1071679 RepID=UPI0038B7E6FF